MLTPNPYMMFATALGFSAADITANRLGVLTSDQRQKLLSKRLRAIRWLVTGLLLFWTNACVFQLDVLVVVFVSAVLITITLAVWQRFQDDLTLPVEVVAGQWVPRPLPLGRCAAVVNGRTFTLSGSLAAIFHKDACYRLYYTAGTHTILAAELLS